MQKIINLEEIFNDNYDCYSINSQPALTKEKFKELILEINKQVLELAAKNVDFDRSRLLYTGGAGCVWAKSVVIDSKTILDTIKQIEK